jgi:hypothetical protein
MRDLSWFFAGTALALGLGALACGADQGASYQLEGDCDPPAGAATVTPLGSYTLDCDVSFGDAGALAVTTQAQLDALLGSCPAPVPPGPIDFTVNEALVVRGYGIDGYSAEVDFVVDDGVHLDLGLMYRGSGFPFPNLLLVVPRTTSPMTVLSCRQVCTSGCDQAIP